MKIHPTIPSFLWRFGGCGEKVKGCVRCKEIPVETNTGNDKYQESSRWKPEKLLVALSRTRVLTVQNSRVLWDSQK